MNAASGGRRAMLLLAMLASGSGAAAAGPSTRQRPMTLPGKPPRPVVQTPLARDDTATLRSIFEIPAQAPAGVMPRPGQRQNADQLVPAYRPLARLSGRIETRVASRIDSRIDQAGNAPPSAAPFAIAADRARDANTRPR